MKKAVVTGATGFIGKALTTSLLKEGYEVYGIGRLEEKFKDFDNEIRFHKVVLDFEQYGKIYEILNGVQIDTFYHTAYRGVNGPKKNDYLVQLQNLEISCKTVEQAVKLGCKRYIYIGSVDEYEIAKRPDMQFTEPTHSRIYAAIKYSSEIIGKVIAYENKMEYVAALLALTYGVGNKTNILPNMLIRNSLTNNPINLIIGNNYFDMIHIKEAIQGIINVANNGNAYESYYIGHEYLRTFREIVEEISGIIDNKVPLNFGTYPDPSFCFDYSLIDRGKLFRDTGYICDLPLKNAINETKDWLTKYI
jgi:nucleoside-diphosphate-sugar epimerase